MLAVLPYKGRSCDGETKLATLLSENKSCSHLSVCVLSLGWVLWQADLCGQKVVVHSDNTGPEVLLVLLFKVCFVVMCAIGSGCIQ